VDRYKCLVFDNTSGVLRCVQYFPTLSLRDRKVTRHPNSQFQSMINVDSALEINAWILASIELNDGYAEEPM
jgi:hypothetical protein